MYRELANYSVIGYTYEIWGSSSIVYPANLSRAIEDENLCLIELWDGTSSENGLDGQCVASYRRDKNGNFKIHRHHKNRKP